MDQEEDVVLISSDGDEMDTEIVSPERVPAKRKRSDCLLSDYEASDDDDSEVLSSDGSVWGEFFEIKPPPPEDEQHVSVESIPDDEVHSSFSSTLPCSMESDRKASEVHQPSPEAMRSHSPVADEHDVSDFDTTDKRLNFLLDNMSSRSDEKAEKVPSAHSILSCELPRRSFKDDDHVTGTPQDDKAAEGKESGELTGDAVKMAVDLRDAQYLACCGSETVFLDRRPVPPSISSTSPADQAVQDDFYGMGHDVKSSVFDTFNITHLHQWQSDMLAKHINEDDGGKNALILAPTSGGKTLVAVILLLRTLLLEKKDGILVLPYVAIVAEKVQELKQLAIRLPQFAVAEYAGPKGQFPVPKRKTYLRTLFVCTPEKATAVWKFLCEEGQRREDIGLACVDECHMMGDGVRGAILEELIASLLHWFSPSARILALSATIGNPDAVRRFLGGGRSCQCNLYNVSRRPNKIEERIIVSGVSFPIVRTEDGRGSIANSERGPDLLDEVRDGALLKCEACRTFDDRVIAKLVFESMAKGDSVLLFCNTRKLCISICDMLTKCQTELGGGRGSSCDDSTYGVEVALQRRLVSGHLQNESKGMVNPILLAGISCGIAFHSAELHPTERTAVEDAYKRKIISVLCCTSTLAAGVNLPASRVIINSPWNGKSFLSGSQYLQMTGRAGRTNMGKANITPDAFILLQPQDRERFATLLEHPVENVKSQIPQPCTHYQRSRRGRSDGSPSEYTGVTRLILTSLSMGRPTMQMSELVAFYKLTLLYQCGVDNANSQFSIRPLLKELLELLNHGHVQLVTSDVENGEFGNLTVVSEERAETIHRAESAIPLGELKILPTKEEEEFKGSLKEALEKNCITIRDHWMRLSPIATASSAGSISIEDAESFVKEAQSFHDEMSLVNPLAFLYLSITETMSKSLIQDPQYREEENSKFAWIIGKMIARDFNNHPDKRFMLKIGLSHELLNEWVFGNPSVRKNDHFNHVLTRFYSAHFLKELLHHPERFETLCLTYGFDRPMALELSNMLASRCSNLRNFCLKISQFWWYPPLANYMVKKLGYTCEDEVRPLLALRHVTVERAKSMFQIGLHSIEDVAQVFPPTDLSAKIPHVSRWMAVEIVLDARMLVAHEASLFEAESTDRKKFLE